MSRYRHALPQLSDRIIPGPTADRDVLIFHHGYELPDFAAFVLLDDEAGIETLRSYYRDHAALARAAGAGFIFESPTWRASPDWAARLGYTDEALAAANRKAIDTLVEIRSELEGDGPPMVVSGCVGPRGDGYQPSALMTAGEAQSYHSTQIGTFAETEADMMTAITITYADEALGIVRAAHDAGMPGRHLVHRRDRRRPARRHLVGAGHQRGRRRHGGLPRLLHGQLRAPHPLRPRPGVREVNGASASEGSGPTRPA